MSLYFAELSTNMVSFGNPTHLNNLDPATYVFLFRPNRDTTVTAQTITKQDTTTNNGVVFGLRGVAAGFYRGLVNRATGLMSCNTTGAYVGANTWNFLAFTYSVAGTASINAFFATLDRPFSNVTSGAALGSGAKNDDSAEPLQIGPKDAASDAAEASVAFLGIWARILTLQELNEVRVNVLSLLGQWPGVPVPQYMIPFGNRLFVLPGHNGPTGRVIDWSPYANHGIPSGPVVGQDVPVFTTIGSF